MHTHYSVLTVLGAFLGIVIVGTAWRLTAYRLASSPRQEFRNLGAAMAFQY